MILPTSHEPFVVPLRLSTVVFPNGSRALLYPGDGLVEPVVKAALGEWDARR